MKSDKKQQKVKAILWDMDGVLIDSESHYRRAEVGLFAKFGIQISDEIGKNFMGVPFSKYFPELAKKYNKKVDLEVALEQYNQLIVDLYTNEVALTPKIIDVLKSLNSKYLFALATSTRKELAELVLKRLNLYIFFKVKIFGNQVRNSKPDPEIFLLAAKKLGVSPKECIVIEDSFNGIKAGKAAGMKVIAYKAEHNSFFDFSSADYVVEDLREILGILDSKLL